MRELIVSKVLKTGDTIALISISGGGAGDREMLYRCAKRPAASLSL